MGGGNKKHKRGSIPSSTVVSTTELIQRTPENDYGVLSDPDENNPSTPVHLLTKEASYDATREGEVSPEETATAASSIDHGSSHTPSELSEQSQPQHSPQLTQQPAQLSSQPQSLSLQQPSPSLQSQKSQNQLPSKSLDALKLKLSRDKNFSRKITVHTFFSYIILAIEMQRSCSASIARISPREVETLITYMIEHHSATEDIKSYLQTLAETKVIHNLIEAVIEFNKDQIDALDKLFTTEEIELQEMNTKETNTKTNKVDVPVTIASSDTTPPSSNLPQTSQHRTGFFKRMRCFFSGCCG
jgi:predicted O-linked N-acetylglucosamine transferase (SPINDLY family)